MHATMAPSISRSGLEALDGEERFEGRTDGLARAGGPVGAGQRHPNPPPAVGPHDRDGVAKLFARLGLESRYRRRLAEHRHRHT
jgi:hypothetical protein